MPSQAMTLTAPNATPITPLGRLRSLLRGRLARNVAWLGGAQFAGRLVRLATTVVVARTLSPDVYGQAAIVLAVNEFLHVLTRRGTVSKLVQAPAADLTPLADTAYWLNWLLCVALCAGQALLALPVGLAYEDTALVAPIAVLGLGYLLLPFAMVHTALNLRANRLAVVARAEGLQIVVGGLLTVAFALLGLGLWSLVLPRLLVIPLWVWVHRRAVPWEPPRRLTLTRWQEIAVFGRSVVGSELLSTLRHNADYLLIGLLLGFEAVGVYYFAVNAGLGISLGLVTAFGAAVFPHLCETNHDLARLQDRFRRSLRLLALIAVPIIMLQVAAAPLYVPLVYGEHWVEAGALPILMLLCLSALPRPFAEAASQLLVATNRPRADLAWNLLFTGLLVTTVLAGIAGGTTGVALAVLMTHLVCLPLFARWAHRKVFGTATVANPHAAQEN